MDATTDLPRSRRRRRPAQSVSPPPAASNDHGAGPEKYDLDEPTMAEKLAALSLPAAGDAEEEAQAATALVPPSADSIHVVLRQALRADDRAALLACLYNRDDKAMLLVISFPWTIALALVEIFREVIVKSISLLTPADAVKLLKGSVLVCLLPWLQNLLSRHMSSIVSQESSLVLLNSLYQLIDARTSTFASSLKLSTCLDYHFSEIGDDESDEEEGAPLIIYEDKDSDEEESEVEDATETEDKETGEEESEVDDM